MTSQASYQTKPSRLSLGESSTWIILIELWKVGVESHSAVWPISADGASSKHSAKELTLSSVAESRTLVLSLALQFGGMGGPMMLGISWPEPLLPDVRIHS